MSSDGQDGRAGLEAQRRAIAAACRRRGWQLLEPVEEADFSADELRRPGVQEALRVLEFADAKALVAWKLDSLSRLLLDLACLLASAQKQGWALAALDCTLKTTTPAGQAMANVLATFAPFERRLISQRTRQALAAKRAQGVRLGRPPKMSQYAIERIRRERAAGTAWPRSRTDSTPTASPPHRAAGAGIRPPSATRSTAQTDRLSPRRRMREQRHPWPAHALR